MKIHIIIFSCDSWFNSLLITVIRVIRGSTYYALC